MAGELNMMTLIKGDEKYVFFFDDQQGAMVSGGFDSCRVFFLTFQ